MNVDIYIGDMRERLAELADESVDAVVTDPPYHLTTGKKGGSGRASLNPNSPAGRSRIGTGFMGKAWDGGDIAFRPSTWRALLRVAKPGAHLVAFGGTRTFHRIWRAVELGGWEIRDTMMWLYGSGFPKSSNQEGAWEGWGTALKPAFEPIVLARKPLAGNTSQNLQRYRVGALNIEACRVETDDDLNGGAYSGELRQRDEYSSTDGERSVPFSRFNRGAGAYEQPLGRWPANVLHDGSEEVVAAFPESDGQLVDASSSSSSRKTQHVYGHMKRGNGRDGEASADSDNDGAVGFKMKPGARRGDSGSAARFFWCPKASREDRNEGLQGLPKRAVNWSSGDENPGSFQSEGTEREQQNFHPTVKPTELMQYLCRLVAPRGATILDPFMGSGSTGKAAVLEGMHFIGIEGEGDYAEIARRRVEVRDPLFTRAVVR